MILNLDSGTGRLVVKLLFRLRLLVFVLYPVSLNTTALSQETDRNHGPFKTSFRIILDKIVQERMFKKRKLVGVVIFDGVDPETGVLVRKNAFQEGFSKVHCLKAWTKIGAALMTRVCLSDK